jgi:hypothetical protein
MIVLRKTHKANPVASAVVVVVGVVQNAVNTPNAERSFVAGYFSHTKDPESLKMPRTRVLGVPYAVGDMGLMIC